MQISDLILILDVMSALNEEILKHMYQTPDNEWCCSVCGKQAKSKTDITRHIESLHIENHPGYTCELCGVVKKSRNALRQHKNQSH